MWDRVVEGFTPTAAELHAYAGRYASIDLNITYTIAVRGSGLVLQIPGRDQIVLQPVFQDAFYGSLVDLIKFTGGAGTRRAAFTINRAVVRNLRFDRVP